MEALFLITWFDKVPKGNLHPTTQLSQLIAVQTHLINRVCATITNSQQGYTRRPTVVASFRAFHVNTDERHEYHFGSHILHEYAYAPHLMLFDLVV